jgi:3-hydroxybutyryl-CoA dehydrogenase
MEVRTIAVIGATKTGCEIAAASMLAGYETILEDVSDAVLDRAVARIHQSLDLSVHHGTLTAGARDAARKNLATAAAVEAAVREADLIIETVADEEEMKIELFTIFDKFAKPGSIFATDTESLRIGDLAAVTFCPDRCIGLRFSPEHANGESAQPIQLVAGPETSEETIDRCRGFARSLGREIMLIRELSASGRASRDKVELESADSRGSAATPRSLSDPP